MISRLLSFPVTVGQGVILFLVTCIVTSIVIIPPITFLLRGWPTKLKQILNDFDPDTIRFYFSRYWPNERIRGKVSINKNPQRSNITTLKDISTGGFSSPDEDEQVVTELKLLYSSHFGRSLYIAPITLLGLVSLISISLAVRSGIYFSQLEFLGVKTGPPHLLFDYATISGVTGALLWIVGDGVNRMRSGDYLPSDIYGHLLRLTIAIPLGLAFASLANGIGPFLAFSVGTFPLETISRFVRASATKAIGATDDADTDGDEIKCLIGINNDVAHRLMAENIATVLALANCDPIRVMMRTNLDFDVVLDIMDQAIVACRLITSDLPSSNKLVDTLRISGLARASQIAQLLIEMKQDDPVALSLTSTLPGLLNVDGAQLSNVMNDIASDEKTQLVCRLRASGS